MYASSLSTNNNNYNTKSLGNYYPMNSMNFSSHGYNNNLESPTNIKTEPESDHSQHLNSSYEISNTLIENSNQSNCNYNDLTEFDKIVPSRSPVSVATSKYVRGLETICQSNAVNNDERIPSE